MKAARAQPGHHGLGARRPNGARGRRPSPNGAGRRRRPQPLVRLRGGVRGRRFDAGGGPARCRSYSSRHNATEALCDPEETRRFGIALQGVLTQDVRSPCGRVTPLQVGHNAPPVRCLTCDLWVARWFASAAREFLLAESYQIGYASSTNVPVCRSPAGHAGRLHQLRTDQFQGAGTRPLAAA